MFWQYIIVERRRRYHRCKLHLVGAACIFVYATESEHYASDDRVVRHLYGNSDIGEVQVIKYNCGCDQSNATGTSVGQ